MKARLEELNDVAKETDSDAIHVGYTPVESGTYRANLWCSLESPSQFSVIIATLEEMSEDDKFILNLQCDGGDLGTADALIHAMRKCKGTIHIVATGYNASASTIILLEASTYELSDGFTALIHCGSLGSGDGTLSEAKQWSKFYPAWMETQLRKAYAGFLTDDEIGQMIDGKDFALDANEWRTRYQMRVNHRTNVPRAKRRKVVDKLSQ